MCVSETYGGKSKMADVVPTVGSGNVVSIGHVAGDVEIMFTEMCVMFMNRRFKDLEKSEKITLQFILLYRILTRFLQDSRKKSVSQL